MKKMIAFVTAVVIALLPMTVHAEDLEARISALEERVAVLEALILGESSEQETEVSTGESVTLEVGTWVVGEDIPAGKYNLTCTNDAGSVCYVYASLDDKLKDEFYKDFYSVSTEAYKKQYAELFSDDENINVILDSLQTVIYNVYLQDGQCLVIDGASMTFTP